MQRGGAQAPTEHVRGRAAPGEDGPYLAFLTCDANAVVGAVHPKAMPVMLRPGDAVRWLDGAHEDACALAISFPDADMRRLVPVV